MEPCVSDRERIARLEARIDAMGQAIDKAERTLSARLEGMNEIREAMKDQASKLVTRNEVYWMFAALMALCTVVVTIFVGRG